MARFDLLLRQGLVVTEHGESLADIAIQDGVIVEIGEELPGEPRTEIDLDGALVLPGAIDAHVHFNEPGRGDWEGWASGSAALVAGGATGCIEMPLNAHPPTLDLSSFEEKVRLASAHSRADFALWGGLTPGNIEHLHDLAAAGVVGFKAFMSSSGVDDFPRIDDFTLYEGMRIAAALGLPVAVHAENDGIVSGLAANAMRLGRLSARDYLDSRPIVAELEAIGRAITMAEATGCSLHVVHISTGRGAALVAGARARGVDVTAETCPHYLVFTDEDVEHMGAIAKCAPPLRDFASQQDLWTAVLNGEVDLIASDHSPSLPSMKHGNDFFAIWGGISGCQHLLAVMISAGLPRGISLPAIARLTSEAVAARFRLAGKGGIKVGNDADLTWLHRHDPSPIPVSRVRYRHPSSIWDDVPLPVEVAGTIMRGQIVYRDGHLIGQPSGRLLKPAVIATRNWPFDERD